MNNSVLLLFILLIIILIIFISFYTLYSKGNDGNKCCNNDLLYKFSSSICKNDTLLFQTSKRILSNNLQYLIVLSGYYKTKSSLIPISHTFLYDDSSHKYRVQSSEWGCTDVDMDIDVDNNIKLTFSQYGHVYLSARVIPFSPIDPCFSFKKIQNVQK